MTRRLVAVVATALALAACGDHGNDRIPAAASLDPGPPLTTTTLAPVPTVATTAPGAPVVSGRRLAVGEEGRTATGNALRLHGVDVSAPGRVLTDVEGCAATAASQVGPELFELVLDDGAELVPAPDAPEPALRTTTIQAGQCVRGWLAFTVPVDRAAVELVFRGSSVLRWSLA